MIVHLFNIHTMKCVDAQIESDVHDGFREQTGLQSDDDVLAMKRDVYVTYPASEKT